MRLKFVVYRGGYMTLHIKPTAQSPSVILLTTVEAAARLQVSPHTLIDWRRPGGGGPALPWVRHGRRLFYRADDVAAFMARELRDRRYPARLAAPPTGLPDHAARAA
ncbi:MAG TPA: helix-turn-helix domain-containing protein [Acetobacteraceae bacterium]